MIKYISKTRPFYILFTGYIFILTKPRSTTISSTSATGNHTSSLTPTHVSDQDRQKKIHKKSQKSNTRRRNNIYNQTCKKRKTQTRNLDILSPSESLYNLMSKN
jgi:hypothetical protein